MRIMQSAIIPLLAALSTGGCGDASPAPTATESSLASTRASAGVGSFDVPVITVEVLSRASFPDDINAMFRIKSDGGTKVVQVNDPSEVVTARITIQPGGSLGWHTHWGPAIVSVKSGELTVLDADHCKARRYPGGVGFIDPGQGHVHLGFNASKEVTVVLVTFLDVPTGKSPTIPANGPEC